MAASLLDDWNTEIDLPPPVGPGLGQAGPPAALGGEEAPLFGLEHRAEFLARGRGHAVAFAASNDLVFVATSRNFVIRHDISGMTGAVAELELSKSPDARVRRLFVDPLGLHVLAVVAVGGALETLYVPSSWKKAQPLAKLRGVAVTSVAWGPTLGAGSMGEVLLGTDSGALHVLSLEESAGGRGSSSSSGGRLTLLHELRGAVGPVAGLLQVALGPGVRLVLALCGTRVHIFRGGPTLAALFKEYSPGVGSAEPHALELPIEQGAAQLAALCAPLLPEPEVTEGRATLEMPQPEVFAVLSPEGICCGRFDLDPSLSDEGEHLTKLQLLPAAVFQGSGPAAGGGSGDFGGAGSARPLSLALTQHHYVLLYPSKLQMINRLSKGVVQEVPLERVAVPVRGAPALPLGLARDALSGRVLLLAGDDVLEVDSSGEDRDVWRVLLGKGDYGGALRHAATPAQRNAVYLAEAEALLESGDAAAAGERFGRCTAAAPSFEETALRLMGVGEPAAVAAFLRARLETLGPEDRAQATMVATWLTELLLDQLNRALLERGEEGGGGGGDEEEEIEAAAAAAAAAAAGQRAKAAARPAPAHSSSSAALRREAGGSEAEAGGGEEGGAARYARLAAEFRAFLARHVDTLDPGTTVSLLAGYGRLGDLLAYARARGDHEAVLEYLLQRGEAERALEVLRKPSVSPELWYKFAPGLVALAPGATVQAWIDARPELDPRSLLPAVLQFGEGGGGAAGRAEVLRYLQFCVERLGTTDTAIHNLLVDTLSADADSEAALLEYMQHGGRDLLGRPLFDPVHALRLVQERGRLQASVQLLCEVGLFEDAVALALGFDRDLAVAVARRPAGDEGLTRRLWLAIARRAVEGRGGGTEDQAAAIGEVTRLLEECGGAVRIEDVLPLFPDFVEIDAFKDAICSSLERYNLEIEELKREMAASSRTAQAIREDLARVEADRAGVVDSAAPCARCGKPLHQPPPSWGGPSGGAMPKLFLFPSGNAFHGSCLCAEVTAVGTPRQRERIHRLVQGLAKLPQGSTSEAALALRRELEEEVAGEDPFCGEVVARNITQPFVGEGEDASWEL